MRATSGSSSLLITPPASSDSGPTVALIAVAAAIATNSPPRPPTLSSGEPRADEAADQQRRHQHLEHVPARLSERRAERQRRVVVGEQVADQHPGPEPQPAERQERDRHADRKPDDGGDGTGELELVADLRRAVVGAASAATPATYRPWAAHAARGDPTRSASGRRTSSMAGCVAAVPDPWSGSAGSAARAADLSRDAGWSGCSRGVLRARSQPRPFGAGRRSLHVDGGQASAPLRQAFPEGRRNRVEIATRLNATSRPVSKIPRSRSWRPAATGAVESRTTSRVGRSSPPARGGRVDREGAEQPLGGDAALVAERLVDRRESLARRRGVVEADDREVAGHRQAALARGLPGGERERVAEREQRRDAGRAIQQRVGAGAARPRRW